MATIAGVQFPNDDDFMHIVKNDPGFDRIKLGDLAALIYPAGREDALAMAQAVAEGKKLIL